MLLKLKCITVLTFLIVECNVLSLSSGLLNIERGDQDTYDNPDCDSRTENGCKCKDINAECVNSTCERCLCSSSLATFLSSYGKNGQCVKNRHLLFIPASSSSFLVKRFGSECMRPKWNNTLRTHFIKKTSCESDGTKYPYHRWIWTQNNQLMHVTTLRCLQQCPDCLKVVSGKYYWRLQLVNCNSTKTNQLWQCLEKNIFQLKTSKLYMYRSDSGEYIYGTNSSDVRKQIKWRRYSSKESLCSETFGCYDFIQSDILVTDINCGQVEKEIAVPPKEDENSCSVMWEKLQYLDNTKWKKLNFPDKIFTIVRRNNRTFLQLNFSMATNSWTGLIVKLQFSCAQTVNAADSKCIVVKFKTNAAEMCPTTIPSTVSTATVTNIKLITNYPTTSTTDTMANTTAAGAPEKHKSDSSDVAIIAVCVVIAILILFGIIGFIFYKRRRRPAGNKVVDSHGATQPHENDTNPIYSLVNEEASSGSFSSGDKKTNQEPQVDVSMNPIYLPGDHNPTPFFSGDEATYSEPQTSASRECDLYEPGEVHVYHYADVEQNGQRPPPQEHAYDYATGDDVRPVAQQLAIGNQSHGNLRDAQSKEKVLNDNDEQGYGQNPLYQTLEDMDK